MPLRTGGLDDSHSALPGPGEGRAVNPEPVEDDGELAGERHLGPLAADPLSEPDSPGLQGRPPCHPGEQDVGGAVRTMASPALVIRPFRSVAPDWYLRGTRPKCGPTALERENRSGMSTALQ